MKIYRNPDKSIADKVYKAMINKGGYCPCRLDKVEDNLCMCREFREQIADDNYEGFCHCRLYYKEK